MVSIAIRRSAAPTTPPTNIPRPDGPSEVNATPVFWKNRVYVAVGQDPEHGEGVGNLNCIDATKTGDVTKTGQNLVATTKSTAAFPRFPLTRTACCSSAIFPGFVHCLDAETGKLYWTHDMKAHMWGSTLVADGKVYCGDEDGDFVVFAASKEKKILSTDESRRADLFHAGRGQRRALRRIPTRICSRFTTRKRKSDDAQVDRRNQKIELNQKMAEPLARERLIDL